MTSNVKRDFFTSIQKRNLFLPPLRSWRHSTLQGTRQDNICEQIWKSYFEKSLSLFNCKVIGYSPLVASIGDKMQCRACLCWYLSKINIGWRRLSSIYAKNKQTNNQKLNKNLFLPGQKNKQKVQNNLFLSIQKGRKTNKEKVTNNLSLSHLCFSPRVWVSIKATTKEKLKRTFNCGKKGSIINGLISQMMLQGQTWYLVW